jgi:hypothetical protein
MEPPCIDWPPLVDEPIEPPGIEWPPLPCPIPPLPNVPPVFSDVPLPFWAERMHALRAEATDSWLQSFAVIWAFLSMYSLALAPVLTPLPFANTEPEIASAVAAATRSTLFMLSLLM